MTDKKMIKQLAERYKEMCRSPFADGYTFRAFEGRCAEQGFTIDDIKNYIEKEKQERKTKRTESIKSLKEQLKRKEQDLENICKAFDIEYAIDEETGNLIGRCNKLYKKEQECEGLREYHNKCCEEFENKKKELLEKYNQLSRDFYNGKYCNLDKCKQLQIKTQECERLKNEIEFCYSQVVDFDIIATSKSNKLKQAEQRLERIIQMLKNGVKIHDDIIVNKSILQIIDEVIPNENQRTNTGTNK